MTTSTNFNALWQRLFNDEPVRKEIDPAKICFITCVNKEDLYQRCLSTIKMLNIPPGFTVETYTIRGATSLTQAYNEAILNTDAKYKIYLHQDVFIIHSGFLYEMLSIFHNYPQVGMIGVAGTERIPANGLWWWDSRTCYGQVFWEHPNYNRPLVYLPPRYPYQRVRAIDGLIMMTQYDIPWRSDLFHGFHFYDVSQSLEFQKLGFEVVIPPQTSPWFIHAANSSCGPDFWQAHKVFMQEYHAYLNI